MGISQFKIGADHEPSPHYPMPADAEFFKNSLYWKFVQQKAFRWTGTEWVRSLCSVEEFTQSYFHQVSDWAYQSDGGCLIEHRIPPKLAEALERK